MTAPRPGQRVRVTLEATYRGSGNRGFACDTADGSYDFPAEDRALIVEVLPDPEPAWWPPQPGDVIRVGHAATWLRQLGGQWVCRSDTGTIEDADVADSHRYNHDVTLLVRDGKPYVADPPTNPSLEETLAASSGNVTVNADDPLREVADRLWQAIHRD